MALVDYAVEASTVLITVDNPRVNAVSIGMPRDVIDASGERASARSPGAEQRALGNPGSVVELISIYKRLRAFESRMRLADAAPVGEGAAA